MGSVLGLGRSPGEEHGNPLQYSCLENPIDRGASWAAVLKVTKSQTQLGDFHWTVAHQAPHSMGFSRQEYWSGLPCPPSGNLPNSGTEPACLTIPALASSSFTMSATWDAPLVRKAIIKKSTSRKCWRECGERGTPLHHGGNVNWYIHCGKQYGGSLKD